MTRGRIPGWPPFVGPGWLAAYSISGVLWLLLIGFTPVVFVLTLAAGGALWIIALGNKIDSGYWFPPEDRR